MNCGRSWKPRSSAWAISYARPASQGASDGTSANGDQSVRRNFRTVKAQRSNAGDRERQAGFAPSFEAGASAALNCSGSTNLPRVEAPSFVVDGVAGRSPSDYCSVGKATAAVVDSQHVAALDAVGHQTASAVVGPRTS